MSNKLNLSHAKILIVDDQQGNVLLLSKLLRSEGFPNILEITDSREVESTYLRERPDIVLLDLNMPYLDGFQIMARLREIDPEGAPILVLTAQKEMQTRLQALQNGARDFVPKPFDRHEVMARMRNQLESHLLYRKVHEQKEGLEQAVIERTQEVVDTRLEIVRRLGRACEFRDNETGAHIERMSRYSHLLAIKAGLSKEQADMILNASPMHDVGKIGIPDAVLLKPGKLTPEEFEIIKNHPVIGAHILAGSDSPLIQMAEMIARTHHEKWDGTGYPQGLQGEDIPIEGRITAIADVFDALTAIRPYKKAWDANEAADFIAKNAGTHFDPKLSSLFQQALPEIMQIRAQFPDVAASSSAT
jgi:putative two-component system response regulator